MSALPSPRDPAVLPRRQHFSRFSSFFERFTLRASDFFNADATQRSVCCVLTESRARTFAAFGLSRTRLTRMPGRTFNLGHGAVRESDRSLPACGLLRNRGKERRPGSAVLHRGGRERAQINRRGKLDY